MGPNTSHYTLINTSSLPVENPIFLAMYAWNKAYFLVCKIFTSIFWQNHICSNLIGLLWLSHIIRGAQLWIIIYFILEAYIAQKPVIWQQVITTYYEYIYTYVTIDHVDISLVGQQWCTSLYISESTHYMIKWSQFVCYHVYYMYNGEYFWYFDMPNKNCTHKGWYNLLTVHHCWQFGHVFIVKSDVQSNVNSDVQT